VVDPFPSPGLLRGGYQAARFGLRTVAEKRFFREQLLCQATIRAITYPDAGPVSEQTREGAMLFAEVLARTPVPAESNQMLPRMKRWGRRFKHRTRYPDFRGTSRATFFQRISLWAESAATSPEGREILNYADFQGGEFTATEFARRFQEATEWVLLDSKPLNEAQNAVRDRMARDILVGTTDLERMHRLHVLQAAMASFGTGVGGTTVSLLGFDNDWIDSLIFGAVGAGLAAIASVAHSGLIHVTQEMVAARRQVRAWLRQLTKSLLYRYESAGVLPDPHEPDWLPKALYALGCMNSKYLEEFLNEERANVDVEELIGTAERTRDTELKSALLELQTGLRYDAHAIPYAVAIIIGIVRDVPPSMGEYARLEIPPGGRRREIPPAPPRDQDDQ
jgi:hypothetical protein